MSGVTFKEAFDYAIKCHEVGRIDEAERIYDELLTHVPDHMDLLHLKGVIKNQQSQFKASIELISKAISLIPVDYQSHSAFSIFYQNLANAYFQDDQLQNAEKCYVKSIELDSLNLNAKYNYSRLMLKIGSLENALSMIDEILIASPTYTNALVLKGDVLLCMNKNEDALQCYEKKLSVDTHDIESLIGAGKALIAMGKNEDALAKFQKAVEIDKNNYEGHFQMGLAYEKIDNTDEAMLSFRKALYVNPGMTKAKEKLGLPV